MSWSVFNKDRARWTLESFCGMRQQDPIPFALDRAEAEAFLAEIVGRHPSAHSEFEIREVPSGAETLPSPVPYSLRIIIDGSWTGHQYNDITQDPKSPFALTQSEAQTWLDELDAPLVYEVARIPSTTITTPKPKKPEEEPTYWNVWYSSGRWTTEIYLGHHSEVRQDKHRPFALTKEEATTFAKEQGLVGIDYEVKPIPKDTPTTPHPARKLMPEPKPEPATHYNVWYNFAGTSRWTNDGKMLDRGQNDNAPYALTLEEAANECAKLTKSNGAYYEVKPIPHDTPTTPHPSRKPMTEAVQPAPAPFYSLYDAYTQQWAAFPYQGIEQHPTEPFALAQNEAKEWTLDLNAEKDRLSIKAIPSITKTTPPPIAKPTVVSGTIANHRMGDTVSFFISDRGFLADSATERRINATIISFNEAYAVLGWKPNERHPINAGPRGKGIGPYIANEAEYTYSCTVPSTTSVAGLPDRNLKLDNAAHGARVELYVGADGEIVNERTNHTIPATVLSQKNGRYVVGWKDSETAPPTWLKGIKPLDTMIEGFESYPRYRILDKAHVVASVQESVVHQARVEPVVAPFQAVKPYPTSSKFKHGDHILYKEKPGRFIELHDHRWCLLLESANSFAQYKAESFPVDRDDRDRVANASREWGIEIDKLTRNLSGMYSPPSTDEPDVCAGYGVLSDTVLDPAFQTKVQDPVLGEIKHGQRVMWKGKKGTIIRDASKDKGYVLMDDLDGGMAPASRDSYPPDDVVRASLAKIATELGVEIDVNTRNLGGFSDSILGYHGMVIIDGDAADKQVKADVESKEPDLDEKPESTGMTIATMAIGAAVGALFSAATKDTGSGSVGPRSAASVRVSLDEMAVPIETIEMVATA